MKEELLTITSKHSGGQVVRGHCIFKIPDTEVTMVAAGFADGTHFSKFHWQHHYTQGRQLMTTDEIKKLCPPEIWQAISEGIFPSLDRLKAQIDSAQHRRLTQAEEELQAQVELHWFLREVLLQDACFLLTDHPNSRLFRDIDFFSNPSSKGMVWLREVLTPAVQKLQQQADRLHDSIIRVTNGSSMLDQARASLGIKQATTVEHSRQLLAETDRLFASLQIHSQPQPVPQPVAVPQQPLPVAKPDLPFLPPFVQKAQALDVWWSWWLKDIRKYFYPAFDGKMPQQPKPAWADERTRDIMGRRVDMLQALDLSVQACWKDRLKDDSRSLAASKVLADWESRRQRFCYQDEGSTTHEGLKLNELAEGFWRAAKDGNAQKMMLKKGSPSQPHVYAYMPAKQFLNHFLA